MLSLWKLTVASATLTYMTLKPQDTHWPKKQKDQRCELPLSKCRTWSRHSENYNQD